MSWTPEHAALAKGEGWGLFDVVDGPRVYLKVFPVAGAPVQGAALERMLIERARSRSELHIHALRCVAASQLQAKPAARKKR